jgi:hypothetical protein
MSSTGSVLKNVTGFLPSASVASSPIYATVNVRNTVSAGQKMVIQACQLSAAAITCSTNILIHICSRWGTISCQNNKNRDDTRICSQTMHSLHHYEVWSYSHLTHLHRNGLNRVGVYWPLPCTCVTVLPKALSEPFRVHTYTKTG